MALLRGIHLAHRWLGIGFGILVLAWFISGVVMLFVPRPQLTEIERLQAMPVLVQEHVSVSPFEAWRTLGKPGWPDIVRLSQTGNRALYRFKKGGVWLTVDAKTLQQVFPADHTITQAVRRVSEATGHEVFAPEVKEVICDQWTVASGFDSLRPFFRVDSNNSRGQEFYVSQQTGEIVLDTDRSERFFNWVGTVVHWLYFTQLRQDRGLWRNTVLWSTFGATLMAVSGLWLGIQRLRIRHPYRGVCYSPYREGWKRWHHWLGIVAGIFLLTWLISGWLSLAPFGWLKNTSPTTEERTLLAGGNLDAKVLRTIPHLNRHHGTKEIEWLRFGEQTRVLFRDSRKTQIEILNEQSAGQAETLSLDAIAVRAKGLLPQNQLVSTEWLNEPDAYYFPHRHHPRLLPIARLRFDDEKNTAYYINPITGNIEAKVDDAGRWYRWLFRGIHRLDFPPLGYSEYARIILNILISLVGIALTASGCVLGWRRLCRKV
jgi:uncharacterized iron-regulated membrane protein